MGKRMIVKKTGIKRNFTKKFLAKRRKEIKNKLNNDNNITKITKIKSMREQFYNNNKYKKDNKAVFSEINNFQVDIINKRLENMYKFEKNKTLIENKKYDEYEIENVFLQCNRMEKEFILKSNILKNLPVDLFPITTLMYEINNDDDHIYNVQNIYTEKELLQFSKNIKRYNIKIPRYVSFKNLKDSIKNNKKSLLLEIKNIKDCLLTFLLVKKYYFLSVNYSKKEIIDSSNLFRNDQLIKILRSVNLEDSDPNTLKEINLEEIKSKFKNSTIKKYNIIREKLNDILKDALQYKSTNPIYYFAHYIHLENYDIALNLFNQLNNNQKIHFTETYIEDVIKDEIVRYLNSILIEKIKLIEYNEINYFKRLVKAYNANLDSKTIYNQYNIFKETQKELYNNFKNKFLRYQLKLKYINVIKNGKNIIPKLVKAYNIRIKALRILEEDNQYKEINKGKISENNGSVENDVSKKEKNKNIIIRRKELKHNKIGKSKEIKITKNIKKDNMIKNERNNLHKDNNINDKRKNTTKEKTNNILRKNNKRNKRKIIKRKRKEIINNKNGIKNEEKKTNNSIEINKNNKDQKISKEKEMEIEEIIGKDKKDKQIEEEKEKDNESLNDKNKNTENKDIKPSNENINNKDNINRNNYDIYFQPFTFCDINNNIFNIEFNKDKHSEEEKNNTIDHDIYLNNKKEIINNTYKNNNNNQKNNEPNNINNKDNINEGHMSNPNNFIANIIKNIQIKTNNQIQNNNNNQNYIMNVNTNNYNNNQYQYNNNLFNNGNFISHGQNMNNFEFQEYLLEYYRNAYDNTNDVTEKQKLSLKIMLLMNKHYKNNKSFQ